MDIDIEKLVVRDLKRELDARGEDSRGTKAVLKERLAQVLREEACYKKAVMPDEDARSQADVDPESIARKEAFQMDVRSHDGTDAGTCCWKMMVLFIPTFYYECECA